MSSPEPSQIDFTPETVLKRDIFSETVSGHAAHDPALKLAFRRLDGLPWYSRLLARLLARREAKGLRAVQGIAGTPRLYRADRHGILRGWSEGTPLQLARPEDPAWYADARRLLREMRRRGVTHNDLAKPQNWLMTPEGRAAVIDFQLAAVHSHRGRWFHAAAYEDLRHLMKMKRKFAPHLLTASQRRMVERRSLGSRIWRATGKRLYLFVTRRLMHWSDSEGADHRLDTLEPKLRAALCTRDDIRDLALCTFPRTGRGAGVYAFVETDMEAAALRRLLSEAEVELVQPVARLPREADGTLRRDLLQAIAMNRIDELDALPRTEPALAAELAPIVAGRVNLTDRYR